MCCCASCCIGNVSQYRSTAVTERLAPVNAGTQSLSYIVLCDKYGNQVNPDDTLIKSFSVQVLQCGLKFPAETPPELPPLTQIIHTIGEDCTCDTKYLNNGVFEMKCTPYCNGTGLFCASLTGLDGRIVSSKLNYVHLEVKGGPPSGMHSRIEHFSTNAAVNQTYSLKLYLFDKYYNSVQLNKLDFRRKVHITVLADDTEADFSIKRVDSYYVLRFVTRGRLYIVTITIDGETVPQTPLVISVANHQRNKVGSKLSTLYDSLQSHRKPGLPTQTVERGHILNSALRILSGDNIQYRLRVRFDDERGMDLGGLSKEFFHLLSMELVNPDYALFEFVGSGLYKPNKNSSINPVHLEYFKLTGTMMAKAICEGHNIGVRFTPSVYKYILSLKCDLEDLRMEDTTIHSSLMHLLECRDAGELDKLTFTVSSSHFGALQTVELEDGGSLKSVTMNNKNNYVYQVCRWYLTGCIKAQLQSIKDGFHQIILPSAVADFSADELQVAISGKQHIDVVFLNKRITYHSHVTEQTKKWFREIVGSFTQEELFHFLLFCTGSSSIPPTTHSTSWHLTIETSSYSELGDLPTANSCSNTIHLPKYKTKDVLDTKLRQAISLGREAFLMP